MYETAFDIVALAMRYWFVLIVVYILFRLIQNVLLEFSSERTAQKRAAGYALGLLEIIEPMGSSLRGHTFALKRENTIGSARKCDIRLKSKSVSALHAAVYQKSNKVFLSDYGTKQGVLLNGRRIKKDVPLIGGDEITLGSVVLLLHLSGIEEAKRNDSYYYDEEDEQLFVDKKSIGRYTDTDEAQEEQDEYGDEYYSDEDYEDNEDSADSEDNALEDGSDDNAYEDDDNDHEEYDDDEIKIPKKRSKWDSYGDKRSREDQW